MICSLWFLYYLYGNHCWMNPIESLIPSAFWQFLGPHLLAKDCRSQVNLRCNICNICNTWNRNTTRSISVKQADLVGFLVFQAELARIATTHCFFCETVLWASSFALAAKRMHTCVTIAHKRRTLAPSSQQRPPRSKPWGSRCRAAALTWPQPSRNGQPAGHLKPLQNKCVDCLRNPRSNSQMTLAGWT